MNKIHLFGRVYYFPPIFIGIKLYNRKAVVLGNIALALLTVVVIVLIVR